MFHRWADDRDVRRFSSPAVLDEDRACDPAMNDLQALSDNPETRYSAC
jgi:hypothetical protein